MTKKHYRKHGEKREGIGYVALPHVILRSSEFAALSSKAVKLLLDLLSQYKGDNNGDLCCAWKLMEKRCWRSRDSLDQARKELLKAQFIVLTRQGGRHVASLYAVTFYEIDFCGGKLDISAPTRKFMGSWRTTLPPLPKVLVARQSGQSMKDQHACRVKLKPAA